MRVNGWKVWLGGAAVVVLIGLAAAILPRLQGNSARTPPQPISSTPALETPDRGAPWPHASAIASPPCPIQMRDVTGQTGISFRHTDGSSGKRYIVETVASGLATFDYDGDGLADIYFLSGTPLRGAPEDSERGGNALYRNLGGFRFQDVTDRAGVRSAGYGLGVAVADYDNDGAPDIYVSNYGPKVLYHNNGDGTFTDVTKTAGVADGDQVGAGPCFLDVDGDGNLDLYVANYVDFSYRTHVTRSVGGFPVYAGPTFYRSLRHSLFRNRGDGTFADVSKESGIGAVPGAGMGAVCADYDYDGNTDIFVLNDSAPSFCFHNDGAGKFTEVGVINGLSFNADGLVMGSMGVDCADYDNDGRLDFFQTSFQGQSPVLFRNLGKGCFQDVTAITGAGRNSVNNVKWGCGFADFDNDGHKDLFIGLGHLQDNVEQFDKSTSYAARPVLLRNDGHGKFVDVSDAAGDGMRVLAVARGVALEDLDNDGRIDVVILNSRRPPTILRNVSETGHHWLHVQLRGVKTNRDGVGARVRVTAGDLVQIDEVHSGRGYQSHFGTRLHFGLGSHDRVDRIEIRWIGGGVDVLENVPVDRIQTIAEGTTAVGR